MLHFWKVGREVYDSGSLFPQDVFQKVQSRLAGEGTCPFLLLLFLFFFFFLRFYLFVEDTETQAEGEAGSMQEPDVGLDPGSPGSHPGLEAVLNC